MHGKIVPDWMPPRQPVLRTLRKPSFTPVEEDKDTKEGKDVDASKGEEKAAATA